MNNIPIDVVNHLLQYLYFSPTLPNILLTDKIFYKLIRNSLFFKNYNIIREKLFMYLEDNHYYDNKLIIHDWDKYNSWKWDLKQKFSLNTNIYVDVLDKVDCWSPGIIKSMDIQKTNNTYEKKMHIEFLGWNYNFNEWVTYDKIKPLGSKTLNPYNKYDSLKKLKHTSWILYNTNSCWNFAKLNVLEINTKNIIVKIDGRYVKITPENIDKKIKICTNANGVLCRNNKILANRSFKF